MQGAVHLLTARDVADRLGISLRTVWRWTGSGELPAPVRRGSSGRVVRWKSADIQQYVEALPVQRQSLRAAARQRRIERRRGRP